MSNGAFDEELFNSTAFGVPGFNLPNHLQPNPFNRNNVPFKNTMGGLTITKDMQQDQRIGNSA